MLNKVVILLTVVTLVFGRIEYTLDKQELKEYLQENYDNEDIVNDLIRLRYKRQINSVCPPPTLSEKSICCLDKIFKDTDVLRNAKRDCFEKIKSQVSSQKTDSINPPLRIETVCDNQLSENKKKFYLECVTEKLGMTNGKGKINRAKAKSGILPQLNDKDWIKTSSNPVLNKCIDAANERGGNGNRRDPSCGNGAVKFFDCLYREFETKCPKDKKIDNNSCKAKRPDSTEQNGTNNIQGKPVGLNGDSPSLNLNQHQKPNIQEPNKNIESNPSSINKQPQIFNSNPVPTPMNNQQLNSNNGQQQPNNLGLNPIVNNNNNNNGGSNGPTLTSSLGPLKLTRS